MSPVLTFNAVCPEVPSISTRLPDVCVEVLLITIAFPTEESGSNDIVVTPLIEPVLVIPELLLSIAPDTVKEPPNTVSPVVTFNAV